MDASNTKTVRDLVRNAAVEYGNKVYIRFEDNDNIYDVKYGEFASDCEAISAWAAEKQKRVGHPLHVGFFGGSSKEYLTALFGIMMSGNVVVPLDVQMNLESLSDCLERAAVDIVFYDWDSKELVESAQMRCRLIESIYSLQDGKRVRSIGDLLEKHRGRKSEEDFSEHRCAMILYTSGTTGRPKGVMLSQGNLLDNVFCCDLPGRQDNEVYLSVLPPHHVFCINDDILMAMRYGSTVCLNRDLKKLVDHLKVFKPTSMRCVPMIAKSLLNRINLLELQQPGRIKKDIITEVLGERMHRITTGGGYLSEALAAGYQKIGIEIGQGYGMSECSPKIAAPDWSRPDKSASVGKIVKNCEVRIVDDEVLVRSPSVMMGYYKDAEETAKALDCEGWLHTGDIGYVDEEGFLFLTGRKKNLIILSNGENVAPEQIEQEFEDEALVEDIIVYGSDDTICAEIYPNYARADAEGVADIHKALSEVVKRVNEKLPSFQRIMRLRVRNDPFEKTSSRKIIRSSYFEKREEEKETMSKMQLPETDLQQELYDLAVAAVGHRRFGIHMNLYDVGLDSMGSVLLLSDLYEKIGFSLTLEELMENPRIDMLEQLYWEKTKQQGISYEKKDVYPLTELQLYFAYVMKGNTTANLPFLFKLSPAVNLRHLKWSVEELFRVHPELKARIEWDGEKYVNRRDDDRHIEIPIIILSDKGFELEREKLLKPFMYGKGDDLFHSAIYQTDSANYLFFDLAHIAGDGQTMNLVFDDINRLYKGEELPTEKYTLYEYVLDNMANKSNGSREKDIKYYEDLMQGYESKKSVLTISDFHDLDKADNAVIWGRFDEINRKKLVGFCQRYGVSENVFFLTAFNYCISIFSGEKDIVSTSIHNGRTDSRWNRVAGPLFLTYLFRYNNIPHETVTELLKRMAKQILGTMKCHISTLHMDEMFFQYQGELLNLDTIGDAPSTRERIQLDSLPFHMMVYADDLGYRYELRYWKNRFDGRQLEIFIAAMQAVMTAMFTETSVRKLADHLPDNIFPKHFYIEAGRLNEAAGEKLVGDVGEKELIKVYVLDKKYRKRPFGGWGQLYVLNHKVKGDGESIDYPYGGGTLYRTDRVARILPNGEVSFLNNTGRTIMVEDVQGRLYHDCAEIEKAILDYPAIKYAHVYAQYAQNNKIHLAADVESSHEIKMDDLTRYLAAQVGKEHLPQDWNIKSF